MSLKGIFCYTKCNDYMLLWQFYSPITMNVVTVLIEKIDPPEPILRQFSETSLKFLELVDQIKQRQGSLQIPPARSRPEGRVQLIDGYRRYKAYIHAEVPTMRLHIVEMDDVDYLAAQIQCNTGHEDTDWFDIALHLEKLRNMTDTEMTLAQIAERVKKSKSWVIKTLSLNVLSQHIKDAVRRGEMPIGNAVWLARIPTMYRYQYIKEAKISSTREFEKIAQQIIRDYRESIKQGKLVNIGKDEFCPNMRDLRIIEAELKSPNYLPIMLAAAGITNPAEAAHLALKWAFRIDPESIKERAEKIINFENQRINDEERRRNDRRLMKHEEKFQIGA